MENTTATPPSPERLSSHQELVGLQVRLLKGAEALKSQTEINEVDENSLGKEVAPDVVGKIEEKSVALRESYWQKREEREFSSQLTSWKETTVSLLTSDGNKDKVEALSRLRAIGVNFNSFDDTQAQALYDRYFKKDDEGNIGGFSKFKADVITSYTDDQGVIDYQALKQDLPTVEWLAAIFGIDEGEKERFLTEIITQSISAEARVKAEPEKLIQEVNEKKDGKPRGDRRLTIHEMELLNYLNGAPLPTTEPKEKTTEAEESQPETTEPTLKPSEPPPPQPETNTDKFNLTPQLAETDKNLYKQQLFSLLESQYPNIFLIWSKLEKLGKVSKNRLSLDSTTWECESDTNDGITLGTRPMPQAIKKSIIFEDQDQSYPDLIIYKLTHELSHKLIAHLVNHDKTAEEALLHLNSVLTILRQAHPDQGIIPLANISIYKASGAGIQAKEEITELVNMYLLNPNYLQRYLDFLTKDEYRSIRDKYGLIKLEPDVARVLFETIQVSVDPFIKESVRSVN